MLEQMPPEVVTRICEYAYENEDDLRSLLQVSQWYHKLAAAVLYRNIPLHLDHLQSSITHWTALLDRTNLWKAPRCVMIKDIRGAPSMENQDPIRSGDKGTRATMRGAAQLCQTDTQATPLATFLSKLSSIGTLIWYSDALPAPSLQALLRNELSGCKIHLKAFSVRPCDSDLEHLQSLATLPNLHSIWFKETSMARLQDLIQRVVKSRRAALEEVRMSYYSIKHAEPSPLSFNDQDFTTLDKYQLGRLRSLQLAGHGDGHVSLLSWTRCTDFSYLRQLSIELVTTQSSLDMLSALQLRSLENLAITLDQDNSSVQYYTTMQTFLCGIRPLSRLRLTGDCESSSLKTVLNHHGAALRTLYLVPSGGKAGNHFIFSASTISLVTETCKDVIELGITMCRQWSTPGEDIAVLKAIGRLHHLSELDLIFYPSGLVAGTSSAMESLPLPDSEHHVRDAMINSSIDIDLAKAVFNTIISSTTSNSLRDDGMEPYPNTSRLRRMSLKATDPAYFKEELDFYLGEVVREIGRRWVVVKQHSVEADLEAQRDELESDVWEPPEVLGMQIEPILRTIWPDKGGDWFDEWEAYPLKEEE